MGKRGYLALALIVLCSSLAWAQIDPGTPDTLRLGTATATAFGQQVFINVFGYNDETISGVAVPLRFNGVALIPDSVSYLGGRMNDAAIKPVTIDTVGQTIIFGAVYFSGGIPAGSGLLAKIYFTVKNSVAPDTVDLDTALSLGLLSYVEPNTNEFTPRFVPGHVFVNVPGPPQPHDPVLTVPGPQQVYGGFNIAFSVSATDVDTANVLTITMSNAPPGASFNHTPKKSPASGLFSWTTTPADTLNSPYLVTFIVNDGTGRADTGVVSVEVLPFATPPSGQDGDLNGDGNITLVDVVYLLNFLFDDGPPPNPLAAGDINGDCFITLADVVYLSNYVLSNGPAPKPFCLPGDVNHDGFVNLPDIIYFINYLLKSGPVPLSLKSTDVNGDCSINLADVVYLINFIFKGGPLPVPGCVVLTGQVASAKLPVAEMGMKSAKVADDVLEINIELNNSRTVAGLMLIIEYDPSRLRGLRPMLTSRSQDMDLHFNDKGFKQTIGLTDLDNLAKIPSGQGSVLTLRYQILDSTQLENALRITYSEVVAPDAANFEVRMVKSFDSGLQLDK